MAGNLLVRATRLKRRPLGGLQLPASDPYVRLEKKMCPRNKDTETLVAHDVHETIWLRLGRLKSPNLCHKVLTRRHPALSPDVIDDKAEGLASAIRSCLGYWRTNAEALNSRVLSRYYAILQASIAELVASADPHENLARAQKHNEQGHGLFSLIDPDARFPANHLIGALVGGHFYAYCKAQGIDVKPWAFEKRPRDLSKLTPQERGKLIPLVDFLRRIPELEPIVLESLDAAPLSFPVGHSDENLKSVSNRMERSVFGERGIGGNLPPEPRVTTTIAAIYAGPEHTVESLAALGLPFKNLQVRNATQSGPYHVVGEIEHPSDLVWWDAFEHYKSGYSSTSVVAPFWGMDDPFVIHLIVLYTFSIVVRYLPSLWHEIEQGELNHVHSFLEYYMSIVDNVLPKLVLERTTGIPSHVAQPGGWDAPI